MIHSPYQRPLVLKHKKKRAPLTLEPQLLVGLALALGGTATLIFGINRVKNYPNTTGEFIGSLSQPSNWCIYAGVLVAMLGAYFTLVSLLKRRT